MSQINTNGTTTVFTTAPADFDYGWTNEIEAIAGVDASITTKVWRRVEIDARRSDGQCIGQWMRYGSGLYPVVDPTEFAKLIEYGLVIAVKAGRDALKVAA